MNLRKIKIDKQNNRMKNKKGSLADIFIWMAVAFVTILFFAVFMEKVVEN